MKIDITSLCFGFKIGKDNDSGTPAWATSIGQAPRGICYIRTDIPGLDEFMYGMMYKAHSDFDNLKDRNVPGVDKKEEPRGDRERMMFSVFDDVFVNNQRVDGIYTLTYERENSKSHKNRLHICYAKYLTYKGHSNKETLSKIAETLGCKNENACWFVTDISIKNQSELHFTAVVVNENGPMTYPDSKTRKKDWESKIPESKESNASYSCIEYINQLIFYGAPGTGKSYAVNAVTTQYPDTIRTTFHPDSDYSTFVGAYKPTSYHDNRYVMDGSNPIAMKYPNDDEIENRRGQNIKESKIEYRFVKQAFLKAYIKAWQLYSQAENLENIEPQFLVIEEINRGNCAQIFGDLFQLLDRKNGFSEYPIDADEDIHKSLLSENTELDPSFGETGLNLSAEHRNAINNLYNEGNEASRDYADDICKGRILALPPNLYIWATMNTSDQSLFPIDSAFKRRWDWQYIKISEGKKEDSITPLGWKLLVEDDEQDRVRLYDWWRFLQLINTKIFGATDSADKQMGYFFAKATESFTGEKLGIIDKEGKFEQGTQSPINCDYITAETFVNKVLFYLWTDVLKDNEYEEITKLMKDGNQDLSFPDFFGETGKEISPEALRAFLDNVMKEEDVRCEVAEWIVVTPQTNGNANGITNSGFKPKSVIFKITDNIQDPIALYERARGSWRMAEKRALETKYFYAYSTPVKRITACYEVNAPVEQRPQPDGKIRYRFEGTEVTDPMVGQSVEAISHSRGQVVFYPDNWNGIQTDDNNDKESLDENPV